MVVPVTKKQVVVCCDGSWCGDTAGTVSNIKLLADCFAGKVLEQDSDYLCERTKDGVVVKYYEGIGLAGSFQDYIVNGAIADDIAAACTAAYRFIATQFEEGSEVWMFGLSRGAHTVRSVCGMINNWGIVDISKIGGDDKLDTFCDAVYRMYRSRDEQYHPSSRYAAEFKARFSHARGRPPIKFLGLLDTVGALGVPNINPGVGLSYEFYDQNVSSEVANVYQALSVHDRLSVFEPCFVRRAAAKQALPCQEVWFAGAHYDIGRQRFVFPRAKGSLVERAVHDVNDVFNVLMTNVEPTLECSAAVLDWMLARIAATEADVTMLLDPAGAMKRCWTEPWEDHVIHLPALKKNAYDELLHRFKLVGILHPFGSIILRDRDVPAYCEKTCFYVRPDGSVADKQLRSDSSAADKQLLSKESGFQSRSYDAFRCLRPSDMEVKFVKGPCLELSHGTSKSRV